MQKENWFLIALAVLGLLLCGISGCATYDSYGRRIITVDEQRVFDRDQIGRNR
jgi:hypothetical protein